MNAHTHGPWRVTAVSETNIVDFGGNDVAVVCGNYDIDYERMAYQAQLIAAAPDLLRELLQVRDAIKGPSTARTARDHLVTVGQRMELSLERIEAAIAKVQS